MTLEEKLAAFDAEVAAAFDSVMEECAARRDELVALARTRHVWGHETYGDGYLFDLDLRELTEERDQEIADGIVYEMVRRRKLEGRA